MLPKLPRLRARTNKRGVVHYYWDAGGVPRQWPPLGTDAAVVLRRYNELMAASKVVPRSVDAMIGECMDLLRRQRKVKPATLQNYAGYRKHLVAVFVTPPEDITQADVLKYLAQCPRKSFRGEIGLLSMAFVNWMDQGRLTFNPCFGVRCKRPPSKRDRLLLDDEIDAIVAAADERLAVAIELAYATGMRISDICALRWADLGGPIRTLKTGVRQALEDTEALRTILTRARALQVRVGSLFVLCNRGGRRWTTGALRDRWDKAVKAAGVEDAHFHDLRAAAGTEVERQRGKRGAQEFLGHLHENTTDRYLRGKRVIVVTPLARKRG